MVAADYRLVLTGADTAWSEPNPESRPARPETLQRKAWPTAGLIKTERGKKRARQPADLLGGLAFGGVPDALSA